MYRTVLIAALVVRIAAAFAWQSKIDVENKLFAFGDSQTYWVLAEKIADGRPYDYAGPSSRIFRAPIYPIFLAPATWLNGRLAVLVARIAGCLLGVCAVGLVMLAAFHIAGRPAAIFAGFLAAIYPGAIGMSIFILSEAVFCPLLLGCLIAWQISVEKKSPIYWAVFSGIACALATLARPSWLLWPVLLALGSVLVCWLTEDESIAKSDRFRFVFLRLMLFAAFMSATMAPWWLRNYQITGRFVPTTLQVGASLYDGLHPGASGASDEGMAFSIPFEHELRAEDEKKTSASTHQLDQSKMTEDTFEWRLNQRLLNAAITWAVENRSDTFRLAMVKFAKMWNPWPTAKELGGAWIRIAESVVYIVIVGWAAFALWSAGSLRHKMMLYASPAIYFAALHMVFVGSVRYRQPAILALCVVAGIGAAWMLERIKKPNRNSLTGKP